jgi:hypothetical protein
MIKISDISRLLRVGKLTPGNYPLGGKALLKVFKTPEGKIKYTIRNLGGEGTVIPKTDIVRNQPRTLGSVGFKKHGCID